MWRRALALLAATSTLGGALATQSDAEAPAEHFVDAGRRAFVCIAPRHGEPRVDARTQAKDGDLIYYETDPPIIDGRHAGPFTLTLVVRGSVDAIELELPDGSRRKLARKRVIETASATASVFEHTLNSTESMRWTLGFDSPDHDTGLVYVAPKPPNKRLTLRRRSHLPTKAKVRRLDRGRIGYASNVVNIVVPELREELISGGGPAWGIAKQVSRMFFEHFEDTYQSLAIAFEPYYLEGSWGAMYGRWANAVEGIGVAVHDSTSVILGSENVLGMGVYKHPFDLGGGIWQHEIYHQYGQWIDLDKLAGFNFPFFAHGPWIIGRESGTGGMIGKNSVDIVKRNGAWVAEERDIIDFHPIQLYAWGLIPAADVPPMYVFPDQWINPRPGDAIPGRPRKVTIEQVIDKYGPRKGPVHKTWNNALIVISAEPMSKNSIRYFNFLARRIEDPENEGLLSRFGNVSMETATGGRVDLRTDIRPLRGAQIAADFETTSPDYDPQVTPWLSLDKPFPSRLKAGAKFTIAGNCQGTGGYMRAWFYDRNAGSFSGDATVGTGRFGFTATAPITPAVYDLRVTHSDARCRFTLQDIRVAE